jgi:hypothetical protein
VHVYVEGRKHRIAGCGSAAVEFLVATSTAGSSMMDAQAEAPAHPKEADRYLPVHDLPPKREKPAMTAYEWLELEKGLITVRVRQMSAGKAKRGGARAQPTNP